MERLNLSLNCSRLLRLQDAGSVHFYALHFVFPVQLLVGVVGNGLNLAILNSYAVRTKARTFLACLAASDLAFLLCFLPEFLSTFPGPVTSPAFRQAYFALRMPATTAANAFSAASIWSPLLLPLPLASTSPCRLQVHADRDDRALHGHPPPPSRVPHPQASPRRPHHRSPPIPFPSSSSHLHVTSLALAGVFVTAFAISFYYNLWYDQVPIRRCENETDLPMYR